eukprot:5619169-Pleurochrysis_carterae.AAC.2
MLRLAFTVATSDANRAETTCCSDEAAFLSALAAACTCEQQAAYSMPRHSRLLRRPAHAEASVQ